MSKGQRSSAQNSYPSEYANGLPAGRFVIYLLNWVLKHATHQHSELAKLNHTQKRCIYIKMNESSIKNQKHKLII
jgi:hypothetical protein